MKDFMGVEVGVGDKVLYAHRVADTARLSRGIVVGVVEHGGRRKLRVIRLAAFGAAGLIAGNIELTQNLAVVGSVPVVSLDALIEASAAERDADRKWQTVTFEERIATRDAGVALFKEIWGD